MLVEEYNWIQRIEANVDAAWDDLTNFEKRFIERLLERFRKYQRNTLISPDEWRIITEISDKVIP